MAITPDVPDYDDRAFADFKEEPPLKPTPLHFCERVAIELGIFQPSKIEWENEIPAAQAGSKPRRAYAHKKMGFEPIGATDPALGSYSRRLTGSAARTEKNGLAPD